MRPAALLLDFGGVIADAPEPRAAPPEMVLKLYNLTAGVLTPGEIQRSFTEGAEAYARWRDEDHPDELPAVEVWDRFMLRGWPRSAQAKVRAYVAGLLGDYVKGGGSVLMASHDEAFATASSTDIAAMEALGGAG